jgi:hypothetical protein
MTRDLERSDVYVDGAQNRCWIDFEVVFEASPFTLLMLMIRSDPCGLSQLEQTFHLANDLSPRGLVDPKKSQPQQDYHT